MSEVASNLNAPQNHDAQLAAEEIAEGKAKAQEVNVDADYEASKQFSVSEADKTGEGAQAADKATSTQFPVHEPEEPTHETKQSGDPAEFKAIAKEVSHIPDGAHNVDDRLVEKALEKGQAGE